MRRIGGIALTLIALTVHPVAAGLYNTAEQSAVPGRNFPGRNFRDFQEALIPLLQIVSTEVDTPLRKRYLLIQALGTRSGLANLTPEQRLDLSAYLIRIQKFRDAVKILIPAQFEDRDNFLVLANLATAEQLDGQPRRALDYLDEALRMWPRDWDHLSERRRSTLEKMGWKEKDLRWFRKVEGYQLKLLRLRVKESPTQGNNLPKDVDAIFDDGTAGGALQFVGPNGQYQAGKLAPAQRAKLPSDAIEIVEQLLIWMPFDTRLSWLLGELFNAEGDVPGALAVFENVAAKWNPKAAGKSNPKQVTQGGFNRDAPLPKLFEEHMAILKAHPDAQRRMAKDPSASALPPSLESQQKDTRPPFDWQSLAVGFGVGIVVAFLASWQWREIRRRRQMRTIP